MARPHFTRLPRVGNNMLVVNQVSARMTRDLEDQSRKNLSGPPLLRSSLALPLLPFPLLDGLPGEVVVLAQVPARRGSSLVRAQVDVARTPGARERRARIGVGAPGRPGVRRRRRKHVPRRVVATVFPRSRVILDGNGYAVDVKGLSKAGRLARISRWGGTKLARPPAFLSLKGLLGFKWN